MKYIVLGNLIGAIALIYSMISYHRKEKKNILADMIKSNILNLIQYILLGAYSGCVTKIIAIFRDILIIKKEKNDKLNNNYILIIFIIIYIIMGVITYKSILSILPLIAAVTYLIFIWNGNEKQIRRAAFYTTFLWLIYNISVMSIAGAISNTLLLISTYIAIKEENRR